MFFGALSNANNTPLPSNAIQDSTADIFVLSIKCILCCQSISSFTEFKQHLTEASTHTQLKGKNSPLLKIMKCEDCNLEFGETELCVHLIIVHFNIASAHLCSIAEGNRNFECIPCGTRIGTIKTGMRIFSVKPPSTAKISSSGSEIFSQVKYLPYSLFLMGVYFLSLVGALLQLSSSKDAPVYLSEPSATNCEISLEVTDYSTEFSYITAISISKISISTTEVRISTTMIFQKKSVEKFFDF